MIILGDLQEYTTGKSTNMRMFENTVNWIDAQINSGVSINCVLQVGDVTASNEEGQWVNYKKTIAKIEDDVPVILCIGNHDYTWNNQSIIVDRNATLFNKYIDYSKNVDIVASFEEGRRENIIAKVNVGNDIFNVISLEFGPRDEVLDWANGIVSSNTDDRFILMTHEFLDGDGNRISSGSFAAAQLQNTSNNSPEMVWRKIVYNNPNLIAVLCGHNGFYAHCFSPNCIGGQIPQVLFNVQYQPNGGDSWIQVWKIDDSANSVDIFTYNCVSQKIITDSKLLFHYKK